MRYLLPILLLCACLVHASGADIGLGPVPTNVALLAPGPIGSTTPASGAFTTLTASGATTVTNSTASTSSSTGALIVTGGAGVGGQLHVGNIAHVGTTGSVSGTTLLQITGNGTVNNIGVTYNDSNGRAWIVGTSIAATASGAFDLYDNTGGGLKFQVTSGSECRVVLGNLVVNTAGKGLQVKEGSNARMGNSTLAAGTVTVSNTSVTASTRFFLAPHGATVAAVGISAISAGTSFTIKSSSGADTNTVDWIMLEPSP